VERRLEGVKANSGFHLAGALEELKSLKSKLDDDKTAREAIAPALLLIQAERLDVDKTTLKYFAAAVSGAIGGDGHVSSASKRVELVSGEREIALLWAAALAAYGIEAEVRGTGRKFHVVASGGGAARLAGLYFLYGSPPLEGDEKIINHKLAEAVELGTEGLDIRWERLRKTKGGLVAADLIISVSGVAVKYNVYLRRDDILLRFQSTDRSRVELAARLLRLAGVSAEVKKEGGKMAKRHSGRDIWYVLATTDRLAAGRKELRDAVRKVVEEALEKGWVKADKAEGRLKKLEKGLTLREGWPKYLVRLTEGALVVRYQSTNSGNIEREAQRLRDMGLKEGEHFAVKKPEEGRQGYVRILKEGLAYAAWLSVYGEGEQQRLAAEFVERILRRAKEKGEKVYKKVNEIIKEGRARAL
jgi:DUF971 family protein